MKVIEIKVTYYLVILKAGWHDLITNWIKIDNFFSIKFSSNLLATILGLLLALMIPIVILLLENSNSYWDKAVILKKVIHLRRLIIGVLIGSVALIIWNIGFIKIILFSAYIFSFIQICRTLFDAGKWLSDWSELPEGVRLKWHKEILTDSSLNFQELIRIWDDVFKQFVEESNSISWVFPLKEYEEAYESFDLESKLKFISVLIDNLNMKLLFFQHEDYEFWDFAIKNFMKEEAASEDFRLQWHFRSLLSKAVEVISENNYLVYLLLSRLQKLKNKYQGERLRKFLLFFSNQIVELFYLRESNLDDYDLAAKTGWQISNNSLEQKGLEGLTQRVLLSCFFKKVKDTPVNFKNQQKLDNLVEIIFKNADPITLNRGYKILGEMYLTDVLDSADFAYNILNKENKFGLLSRTIVKKMQNNNDADFASEYKSQYQESIRILCFYFGKLIKADFGLEYLKKLKNGIKSGKFKELIENSKGQMVTESMSKVYLNLIEEIEKNVEIQNMKL